MRTVGDCSEEDKPPDRPTVHEKVQAANTAADTRTPRRHATEQARHACSGSLALCGRTRTLPYTMTEVFFCFCFYFEFAEGMQDSCLGAQGGQSARGRVLACYVASAILSAAVLAAFVSRAPTSAAQGVSHAVRPRETQLLQWFGLAQQTVDQGRAPAAGERLEKRMGERDGSIPTGHVASRAPQVMENPLLSAAANARARGTSLRPLLDESGHEDANRAAAQPEPNWVREDYGEVSERHIHKERAAASAAATAAFIENQRAIAQTRWAMRLGMEAGNHAADGKMPSPDEQESGSVDLSKAPSWVRKDYAPESAPVKQARADAASDSLPSDDEKQDNAALADDALLRAEAEHKAELQLSAAGHAASHVQTLASAPRAAHEGAARPSSLRRAAQALVESREAAERAAEERSAAQELSQMERESHRWIGGAHKSGKAVTRRGEAARSVSGGDAGLRADVYGDATLADARLPAADARGDKLSVEGGSTRSGQGKASSKLQARARLQMLSDTSALGGGGVVGASSLVKGLNKILNNLDSMKIAGSRDSQPAAAPKVSTDAARQQQDLLRLASAAGGDLSEKKDAAAVLRALEKQMSAPLKSHDASTAPPADYRRAGAAEEAARIRKLTAPTHTGKARARPSADSEGFASLRGAAVRQRAEDVKMSAIDRLYNKLYGHGDSMGGDSKADAAPAPLQLSNLALQSSRGRGSAATQQLQAAPAPAAPALEPLPETREEKIADGKAELRKAEEDAERPWSGDGDYGAQGDETETSQHTVMMKRRNFVSNVMEHMEHKAYLDGIETQNDVDTIHRLQKAYPYNIKDVSQKWAMCAKRAVQLTEQQRMTCADHFVWLLLKRSINQSYCDPEKKAQKDCMPSDKVRNPGFDTCLNPMLTNVQVHDCLLRITQITANGGSGP